LGSEGSQGKVNHGTHGIHGRPAGGTGVNGGNGAAGRDTGKDLGLDATRVSLLRGRWQCGLSVLPQLAPLPPVQNQFSVCSVYSVVITPGMDRDRKGCPRKDTKGDTNRGQSRVNHGTHGIHGKPAGGTGVNGGNGATGWGNRARRRRPRTHRRTLKRNGNQIGTAEYGLVRSVVWGPEANYLRLPDSASYHHVHAR
jgi:hypothetical protein